MKTILSILTLLSMGMVVHASAPNKQSITNNNYGDNNKNDNHGGSQTGPKIGVHAHVHGHVGRSLKSLFVRDPDFDFAMGILGKNSQQWLNSSFLMAFASSKCGDCGEDC